MTSPPPSKKAKIDAETERLLTQLLLQRGEALQAQANEQGVLAFCRQPVLRGRLNERYLQNTLKSVFTANKRAQEAALWETRGLQKQREESSPRPQQVGRRRSDREGRETSSRHDDQRHQGRGNDRHARNRGEHSQGQVKPRAIQHRDKEDFRSREDRDSEYTRRRGGTGDSRSPSVESERGKSRSYGRRRDEDASHSEASDVLQNGTDRSRRSRRTAPIDGYGDVRQSSRSAPGGSRHESALNQSSFGYDSPRHVSQAIAQGASQHGTPSASAEQSSPTSPGSPSHDQAVGMEDGEHPLSELTIPSNQTNRQDKPADDSNSHASRKDGGSAHTDSEQEGEGWIMNESELQELLGRPVAKGRGGVGSRAEEPGPYLPPGLGRPALEGVVRGPAVPPWLQQQQSAGLPVGMLGNSAAAAKQLLAQDKVLAKLLRKVARRKVEEEEQESEQKQRKHKKRKRSSRERSPNSHKKSSSRKREERESKRKGSSREKKHRRRSSDKRSKKRQRSHSSSDDYSQDDSRTSDRE